jgi:uncharacterized protein with GYD domain
VRAGRIVESAAVGPLSLRMRQAHAGSTSACASDATAMVPVVVSTHPSAEEERMPTYISLFNWTDQGIRDFKESPGRADANVEFVESMGGKLVQLYWTVGPYDLVSIFEAPDDETATAMQLTIGSRGSVRTTTLRAFDREAIENIIAKVP